MLRIRYTDADGKPQTTPPLVRTRSGYRAESGPYRWFLLRLERLYEMDSAYRMRLIGTAPKEEESE